MDPRQRYLVDCKDHIAHRNPARQEGGAADQDPRHDAGVVVGQSERGRRWQYLGRDDGRVLRQQLLAYARFYHRQNLRGVGTLQPRPPLMRDSRRPSNWRTQPVADLVAPVPGNSVGPGLI